jgi:hypothetical protein
MRIDAIATELLAALDESRTLEPISARDPASISTRRIR